MSLVIATLLFFLLIIIILPINILIPTKRLHKLIILLNAKSFEEKNNWTFIDSIFAFSERVYKSSKLKLRNETNDKYWKRLIIAGLNDRVSVECLFGLKLISAAGTILIIIFALFFNPSLITFTALFIAPVIAYFCPDNILYGRGKKRQTQMKMELPDVLNTLAIITDSGLSFSEALKKICEIKKGTLIKEIRKMQDEIDIGELQKNALHKMAERCQVEEISVFVFTLVQSVEKGTSGVTTVLKDQAKELWDKRKNKARELGEKASMKLFLPMLLLVFPCFLIFIIGPALISLLEYFSR